MPPLFEWRDRRPLGGVLHLNFRAATACCRLRGNRSSTNENRFPGAKQAPGMSGQYLLSRSRPFAGDQGKDETGPLETVRTSCPPRIGRSRVAGNSNPKTRGRRVSGSSPVGTAFGKRPRQAVAHLLLHAVEQFHSRSTR